MNQQNPTRENMNKKKDSNGGQPPLIDVVILDDGLSVHIQILGIEFLQVTYNPESLVEALTKFLLARFSPATREQHKKTFMEQMMRKSLGNPTAEDFEKLYEGAIRTRPALIAEYLRKNLGSLVGQASLAILREGALMAGLGVAVKLNKAPEPVSAKQAKKRVLDDYWPFVKDRMGISGPGGARREPADFRADEECAEFARRVNERRPLWKYILKFFEQNGYDAGCPNMLKQSSHFKSLSQNCADVPDDLLKSVFRRKKKTAPEYSPLGFALKHAYLSLGIDRKYHFETLKKRYLRGKKK
jgi:hypothetical protein